MPKRLAITGPYTVEVMEYEDGRIPDGHVLVRTELASGTQNDPRPSHRAGVCHDDRGPLLSVTKR